MRTKIEDIVDVKKIKWSIYFNIARKKNWRGYVNNRQVATINYYKKDNIWTMECMEDEFPFLKNLDEAKNKAQKIYNEFILSGIKKIR